MTHRRIRTVFFFCIYMIRPLIYIENRKLGPWALPRSEAYGRKAVSGRYRAFALSLLPSGLLPAY